jgi:hypothetical protein
VEIPKTMIVERIRSRGGPEMADRADRELPEKLDPDSDADMLREYGLDPDELRDEFRGQSPVAG